MRSIGIDLDAIEERRFSLRFLHTQRLYIRRNIVNRVHGDCTNNQRAETDFQVNQRALRHLRLDVLHRVEKEDVVVVRRRGQENEVRFLLLPVGRRVEGLKGILSYHTARTEGASLNRIPYRTQHALMGWRRGKQARLGTPQGRFRENGDSSQRGFVHLFSVGTLE